MTEPRDVELDPDIMDFTVHRKRIRFRVDPDTFECVPELPVMNLLDFAAMNEKISEARSSDVDGAKKMFHDMFDLVLIDEDVPRFLARLADKRNPIGIEQMQDIINHVMEKYGMRPTEPSDSSPDGSQIPDGGPSSTESSSAAESTSNVLQYPGS